VDRAAHLCAARRLAAARHRLGCRVALVRTHHNIQSPLVINGDDSGAERDASGSLPLLPSAAAADDSPFSVAAWSAFDVLDEFAVIAPAPRVPPVHPPADRSLMCANQLLAELDAEQKRRIGSGLVLALDAGRNGFVELPRALAQPGAAALTHLDLGNCHLTALDALVVEQLTSLVVLDVHNNALLALPPTIGQLTRLRELHLHNSAAELEHAGAGAAAHMATGSPSCRWSSATASRSSCSTCRRTAR
jgi:hypothetical protein